MKIKPIRSFKEITEQVTAKSIVLIDIDDTIFSACSDWGCVKQFVDMVKVEASAGWTEKHAKVQVYNRWVESQSKIKTKLVDPLFLEYFKDIQQKASLVLAFTARQPEIAEITAKQLEVHEIKFNHVEDIKFDVNYPQTLHSDANLSQLLMLQNNCNSKYSNGILFCHDLNSKGDVFTDFFAKVKSYCESKGIETPDQVTFIDDGEHNLKAMDQACQKLGLKFSGYHIQSSHYKYDKNNAKHEEKHKIQRRRSFDDWQQLLSMKEESKTISRI